jgi:hypothetical protein
VQIAGLKEVGELLRRQLDDIRTDRDCWRSQAERLVLPAQYHRYPGRGGDGWPGEFDERSGLSLRGSLVSSFLRLQPLTPSRS